MSSAQQEEAEAEHLSCLCMVMSQMRIVLSWLTETIFFDSSDEKTQVFTMSLCPYSRYEISIPGLIFNIAI